MKDPNDHATVDFVCHPAKPASPTAPPAVDRIPADLKALSQWVCWKWEVRDGKWTKPPYDASTGRYARSNDPTTWCAFETAVTAYQRGGYAGIGFMFWEGDGLTGLDLDHVIDPATGEVDPRALEILEQFKGTYGEKSPSGTGFRIFLRGVPGRTGKNEGRVKWLEVYAHPSHRYLTTTGHHWPGTAATVTEQQAALDWLHDKYLTKPADNRPATTTPSPSMAPDIDDAALIDRSLNAANGDRFRALWNGDTSAHRGDHSAADLALCSLLAFWTGKDADRMDRLFRQSGLMRPKWEREDYRQRTITKAIEECREVYTGGRKGNGPAAEPLRIVKTAPRPGVRTPDQGYPQQPDREIVMSNSQFDPNSAEAPEQPTNKTQYSLLNEKNKLVPQSVAAAILAKHHNGLAYDHIAQKWLIYINTQWKEVTDTVALRILMRWIDKGVDKQGYNITFAHGIAAFLKSRLATDGFDDNPNLVPFCNGVLDLLTGTLHDHSPDLKITWCLPFHHDPTATCEPVTAWLKDCVSGDDLQVELLRAYIKAIITGRSDLQRYIELIGAAGTGKGVFLRLCTHLVGNRNAHVTELKRLENNRFEPSRLYRKRLCIITDAENYSGDVSILKAMTGEDNLPFEEKHKQGGENFKFKGMVLIAANQEIKSSDLTGGLPRRRITVRFDNQVPPGRRRNLEQEFEPYLPGVIAWALSLDNSRMKQLLVETDSYVPTVGGFNLQTLKQVNPIAAWVDDRLILASNTETPVGTKRKMNLSTVVNGHTETRTVIEHADKWLFANYADWCAATGDREVGQKNFTGLLKDLLCNQLRLEGIEKLERSGANLSRFKGIRLRTEADLSIANFLSGTVPVREKYDKSTVDKEEGTRSTEESKFSNEKQTTDTDSAGEDGSETNANIDFYEKQKIPIFPVLLVLPVRAVEKTITYKNLSRTEISTPYGKSSTFPYGDQVEQADPSDGDPSPPGQPAAATPPASTPATCRDCRHLAALACHCKALNVYADPRLEPLCGGNQYVPKEGRS